jgi:hypothetical protein
VVTYFGLVGSNGCAACPDVPNCQCGATPSPTPFFDAQGRQIFEIGIESGFLIVVEAVPGISGASVSTCAANQPPCAERPALQPESTRNLGNGSLAVCDTAPGTGGGIPGIDPPDFGPGQQVTDALIDFSCRFTAFQPSTPCTLNGFGNSSVLTPGTFPSSGRQFCQQVRTIESFPLNDTMLTVQVRDQSGFIGPQKQIVVRRVH